MIHICCHTLEAASFALYPHTQHNAWSWPLYEDSGQGYGSGGYARHAHHFEVKVMVQVGTLGMLITLRSRLWFRWVRSACSSLQGQGHGSGGYARHAHHFEVKVMVQAGTLGMLITSRSS